MRVIFRIGMTGLHDKFRDENDGLLVQGRVGVNLGQILNI